MTLNDILQTTAVAAILIVCVIYLIRRHRRTAAGSKTCDSCTTPCPLKDNGKSQCK